MNNATNSQVTSEEESEDDEIDVEAPTHGCKCLGRQWHSTEFLFFGVLVFGILTMADVFDGDIPELVFAILNLVACATATSMIWNLVSIKRIAAASELLRKDLQRFKKENDRAAAMQDEKRAQDREMQNRLADMGKAEMLLKDSSKGLEGILEQEQEFMAENAKILAEREKLSKRLQEQMAQMSRQSIRTARNQLNKRAIMYFKATDQDDPGIEVGSPDWRLLVSLMMENGITLHAEAAGEDGSLDLGEFRAFLRETFDEHFPKLEQAVIKNNKIEELIISLRLLEGE